MNINDDILEILISEEQINKRCQALAEELDKIYLDKKPILLSLLRGSIPFAATLSKYMTIPLEFDYMRVSSYHGTSSTGSVAVSLMPATQLKGRHVLLIEDIVDTGLTLDTVTKILKDLEPTSLEIVSLLDKPEMRKVDGLKPKFVGFTIPPKFVVGFGLDYNEYYRQLPYVGVLKEEIYKK